MIELKKCLMISYMDVRNDVDVNILKMYVSPLPFHSKSILYDEWKSASPTLSTVESIMHYTTFLPLPRQ
jgi:hypothetical protein